MEEKEIKKERPLLVKIFIFLIIIVVLLYISARYVYPYLFEVNEYLVESENLPEHFDGLKVIHFTDLHYGTTILENEFLDIIEEINVLKPDLVFFTGDLIDQDHLPSESDIISMKTILNGIDAKLGKYYVTGNHDYAIDNFDEIWEETGFIALDNYKEEIYYEGEEAISIYGFPSIISDKPDYSIINEEDNNFKIVLIHEPDAISNIMASKPDLVLSGHSHGGQIRLPFVGALYTPVYSKNYYEAYYKINETEFYISSGLGTTGVKLRFMNVPSFNFYRIYTK